MKKFPLGLIITLGVIAALFIGVFSLYGYANAIRDEAIQKEITLSTDYQVNQNHLSNMMSTFYESVGLADRKSEQLDRILTDALKGRYDTGVTGSRATGAVDGGKLFSAIREAYPDMKGLDVYDKILPQLQGDRSDFKKDQDKFLDELRDYDTWRAKGIFRSWVLGKVFPSEHLVARIGTEVKTGKAAEEQMYQIILNPDAITAYKSGTMAPMTLPPLSPK